MFWRTQLLKDLGLSFIPAELGQLSALQSLYLPYNYLTFLPTDLPPNAIVIKKPHYFDDSSGMTKSQADFSQDLETFDRIIKVVKIRIMSNVCQYRIDRYTIWRSTYPANKAPYPIRRASLSLFTCLEVVPDETSPWNPLIAPQAMVTKSMGKIGGAPGSEISLIAGASIIG